MGLFARYDAPPPPALTYRDNNVVGASTGSHTHSGLAFGPASSTRAIIAALNYSSGGSQAITIGGIAATSIVVSNTPTNGITQIAIALVPTGTSGSVVIPSPGSGVNYISAVAVWSVTDLLSLAATGTDTATGNPASLSVNVNARGIAIAVDFGQGDPTSVAWSGATKDFQNVFSGAVLSGASLTATNAATANITATITAGSLFTPSSVAASFR